MKIFNSILCILLSFSTFAQEDKAKVEETVKKATIEGHIYFLASDELRGREAGEPGADIAAKYLGTTLRRYGVQPVEGAKEGYYQPVALKKSANASTISLKLDGKSFSDAVCHTNSNMNKQAEVVFVGYGLEEDYKKGTDYKGKILLANAGAADNTNSRDLYRLGNQKLKIAEENGALALIEVHSFDSEYWKNVQHFNSKSFVTLATADDKSLRSNIAHVWVNSNEATMGNVKNAELKLSGAKSGVVVSHNVVGMVEGTDPELKDEFIIYSAHYDHVGVGAPNAEGDSIYNGARDNAVGTVTVLSAAENIAKYPTKRSALFILFTAEEKGLLGSKYYVENPLIPLEKMVYCFNSDNASYNDTSKATIVGLERTTASEHIKNAASAFGITAIDDPAPEQNLFDRSDNVHFAKKGIPAPTFSLGFTAFDEEVFKYYHQPADNPDNLDYEYLHKFFSAYVLSCRNIANADETPFWVEGDKYYEAGNKLYNNNK